MQSKFLTDLGIPFEHQMMNETIIGDDRFNSWLDYKMEYGVFPPYTWDFGHTILPQWLYIQMRAFKDQSFWIIDFKSHKYEYKGKETNAEELINLLINDLAWVVAAIEHDYNLDMDRKWNDFEEQQSFMIDFWNLIDSKFKEAMDIIATIWHNLWW